MTYYTQYQWTAFSEAQLLANGRNGSDFGYGDTFTMPKSADTKLTSFDDDATLSGDAWYDWYNYSDDQSGQTGAINNCSTGTQIFAEQYHVLYGSDGGTYYLIEIAVQGDGSNQNYFSFYGAQPGAGVQLTVAQTCNVSGCWINYSCLGAGPLAPPNTPPTFTNIPAEGVFCVQENTRFVVDLNASDKDGDALSYAIVGGADAAAFTIDPQTGVLNFVAAPDYEKPGSADGDNGYKIIVAVNDGKGGVTNAALTVNVCDVAESAPKCMVIEAEKMSRCGYWVECRTSASGGQDVVLDGYSGSLQTVFDGPAGSYNLNLRYLDTSGSGSIRVLVNGKLAQTISLNADDNAWHNADLSNLNLKPGDVITLQGQGYNCEYARIDKITICPTTPPTTLPGALEGRVFIDANKDGIDNNETGVAGVAVQLVDANGAVVATTTTKADGSYKFDNLVPGKYSVTFPTNVGGRVLTAQDVGSNDAVDSDASISTGRTGSYTVVAGQTVHDVDAGLKDPGTAALDGRVFIDANANDVDNAEAGVGGVTVKLIDANGNVIATTTTAADGSYHFGGLDAGSYSVEFPKSVNGMVLVGQNVGSDDTIDSDASQATGRTNPVTVAIGQTSHDNDAGIRDPRTASLGDRVFFDADHDGVQGATEGGVAGVTVTLYDAAGNAVATTTTDGSGNYLFDHLAAGTYTVGFGAKAGYHLTDADRGGNDALDSDANVLTGRTAPVKLAIGEKNLTVDAGLVLNNVAPDARDDAGHTCADKPLTLNVLANDVDTDGGKLAITAVNGTTIAEGQTITAADGVRITMQGGQLVFNATGTAYEDALVGTSKVGHYTYTIGDGQGGFDSANVDVRFCGTDNTLETISAHLPKTGTMTVSIDTAGSNFYTVTVNGTGDARLDGHSFDQAYCGNVNLFHENGIAIPVNIAVNDETHAPASIDREQNLDMVNWILNQDFTHKDNGDGNGHNYTEAEIQGAIWGLTDGFVFVNEAIPAFGTTANAQEIYQLALANGEGFTPDEGDVMALILDPASGASSHQPFIVAIPFDALAVDCLCG